MLKSFGQVRATMLHPGLRTSSSFNTQHVATLRNRVTSGTKHVALNNVAARVGPSMLGYVVLICCDRFAGASDLGSRVKVKLQTIPTLPPLGAVIVPN